MPKILFKCRSCGSQLLQENSSAGRQVDCPICDSSLTIPKTAVVYTCPHSDCSRTVRIDIALRGDGLRCPGCNRAMMLPIRRADMIICLCKRCEKLIEIPSSAAGKLLSCPKCNDWIRGPELTVTADASATTDAVDQAAPPVADNSALATAAKAMPILIVDDNSVDQQLVAIQLEGVRSFNRELDIVFALDGEKALAELRKKDFTLVILDWNLPALGQGEVLRYLRKTGSRIPVVVISGMEHHHLADKLAELKATFLSKDQMTPETFHIAICAALSLVNLNVSHCFGVRTDKTD